MTERTITKSEHDHCTTHHHACDCREYRHLAELAEALRSRDEAHELAARYREDVQDLLRVLGDVEGEDFPEWTPVNEEFGPDECAWGCNGSPSPWRDDGGGHAPDCRYLRLLALLRERPTLKLIGDIS